MATEPAPLPDGSIDPNVVLPKHVRDAGASADALHAQLYAEPQPEPHPEPQPEPHPEPQPAPQPQPTVTATVTDNFTAAPSEQELRESQWASRYNSMRGRWEGTQRQVGLMQGQMEAMAGELTRAQDLLRANAQPTARDQAHPGHAHDQLITAEERETYGEDLINVARKAALEATQPAMDALRAENQDLKKRVITNDQKEIYGELARLVPNWRAINGDQGFKNWLSLPNVYTGQVRGQMLQAAFQAAHAPRVIALFQDFIKEVIATGGTVPGTQAPQQQQVQNPPPVRQPAIALETLAAPGRARPAGGDTPNQPAERPTYTRAQISSNYSERRRGLFNGRETDWARLEADMIAAGNEGRVRG